MRSSGIPILRMLAANCVLGTLSNAPSRSSEKTQSSRAGPRLNALVLLVDAGFAFQCNFSGFS